MDTNNEWSWRVGFGFGVVGLFLISFQAITTIAFIFKRRAPAIWNRSPALTVIQACVGILYYCQTFTKSGLPAVPCFLELWANDFLTPAWFLCILCRTIRLKKEHDLFQEKLLSLSKTVDYQALKRLVSHSKPDKSEKDLNAVGRVSGGKNASVWKRTRTSLAGRSGTNSKSGDERGVGRFSGNGGVSEGGDLDNLPNNESEKEKERRPKSKGMTRASSNPKHEGWDLPPPSEDLPDNLKVVDLPIPVPSPPRKDSTTAAAAAAAAAYNDFTLFSISKESADRQMEINWYLRFRTLELNKWIARLFASSIAAIFIVNAIVQISTPRARMWPTVDWTGTCKLVWEFVPAWLYAGSFLGLGCPILLWRLRNTKDPHLVLVDVYICLVVGLPIALASLAWGLFIDSQFPTSFGAGSMFLVFATVTGHLTSVIMPLMRAFGDERRKRERRILQNMENFMMVLHDPITSGEFEQYTIGDSCVELMIFFQEWQELQRQARALLFANTGYNPTSSQISNQDLSNQSIQSHYSLSQQSQPPLISRFKSLLHTGGASDEDLEWDGGATGFRKNTSTTVTTEASTNPGGTGTSESRPSSPLLPNSTVGSVYQSVSAGSVLPVRSASIMDFIRKAASDRYSAASFMGLPYSAPPGGPSVSATPSGQRLPDGSLSGIGSPPPTLEALVAMSPVPKPIIPLYLGFFQMFVKPDASMAVNCAHNVVQEVVQCVERKELTVGMFNKVKDEVVRNLYLNCFPGFLQSQRARGFYLAPPNLINAPKDLA